MLNSIYDFLNKAFRENTKAQEALKKAGLYSKELKYGFISKESIGTLEEYNNSLFPCSFKELIGYYVLPIDEPILGLVAFNLKGEAIYTNDRTGVINSRALKVFDCVELAPNIFEYLKNPQS